MADVKTSIVIRRSQSETFAYLTDLRNAKEWSTEVVDVRYDDRTLHVGSTGVDIRRMGRRRLEMPWTVTSYEPPARLVLEYAGRFPATAHFSFQEEPDGTRVTCDTELRPRGLWRLLAPVMIAEARRSDAKQFQKVKEILEGRGGGARLQGEGSMR